MYEESIPSPRRQDLLKFMHDIPSIQTPAPNLIFSVATLHTPVLTQTQNSNESFSTYKPKKPKALPVQTRKTPKVTLVLDLDETLVHSEYTMPDHYDYVFKVNLNECVHSIYVSYRPGLKEFLDKIYKKFEVVIFTASMKPYARQVIRSFDPYQRIKHLLYRDYCTEVEGEFVKDLRVLGRDLKNVVIVDNNKRCFMWQPRNGVEIGTWVGDREDKQLKRLFELLMAVRDCADVREGLYNNLSH